MVAEARRTAAVPTGVVVEAGEEPCEESSIRRAQSRTPGVETVGARGDECAAQGRLLPHESGQAVSHCAVAVIDPSLCLIRAEWRYAPVGPAATRCSGCSGGPRFTLRVPGDFCFVAGALRGRGDDSDRPHRIQRACVDERSLSSAGGSHAHGVAEPGPLLRCVGAGHAAHSRGSRSAPERQTRHAVSAAYRSTRPR